MVYGAAVDAVATLRACRTCGLIQAVPLTAHRERAHCVRCDTPFPHGIDQRWTIAAALGALLLYPLAMSLPVLSIERFGVSNQTDIWHGALRLLSDGHLVVGLIVLVCSIIVPLTKLAGLLALSAMPSAWRGRHRALTWRLSEAAGRGGMIDVMLVAGVVAAVKLGDLVSVNAGPGVVVYASMVILSLIAGSTFDPQAMWAREDGRA
jgi:paraquat-inducible protein A